MTRGFLRRTQGMTQKDLLLHKSLIICILHFERYDSQQENIPTNKPSKPSCRAFAAGLKHRSQVRSQVRSIGRIFFCQGNCLCFWGIQKFDFIKGVDNVNWQPYRDFGGRTSYLLLGLYHASVKWTSIISNANTPLPKRLELCWGWLKRITKNIN